jgi:hypothetical protein
MDQFYTGFSQLQELGCQPKKRPRWALPVVVLLLRIDYFCLFSERQSDQRRDILGQRPRQPALPLQVDHLQAEGGCPADDWLPVSIPHPLPPFHGWRNFCFYDKFYFWYIFCVKEFFKIIKIVKSSESLTPHTALEIFLPWNQI